MRRSLAITITLFFFIFNILFPVNLEACWWKGLPSQNPDIGGAPPAQGGLDDDKPNQCQASPIFLHNGDFVLTSQDFFIPSRGLNIELIRTYKSQSRFNGRFGLGWELNYNQRLVLLSDGSVFYLDGEGKRHHFLYLDGKNFISPAELFDKLVQNTDGTYTLTKKDATKYNFNSDGTLSEMVDQNNNKLTFGYHPEGKLPIIGVPLYTNDPKTARLIAYQYLLTKITDTTGREIALSYDVNGRLTKIADFSGRTIDYTYDDFGHLTSVTDPAGNTTQYTYDSDRNLRSITDPKGNTFLTNTYNPLDQVIAQTQGEATTYYSYDTENRITTRTDANGNIWTYYFNEQGNPTKIIDPQENTTVHSYDTNKKMLLTSSTDPKENTTTYEYDANGNLIKITDPKGNITTFTYESKFNKLATTTDSLGRTTTYEYDSKGNLTKVTDALANTTQYTYDSYGNLSSITDANGNTTSYTYDTYGNLTSITDPEGNKTTYTYDSLGRRTSMTDANGDTTQYFYSSTSGCPTGGCGTSGSDKLTKIIYPDDTFEEFEYDSIGNLTKRIDANSNSTLYDYDLLGRLIKVTDSLGNITKYIYDNLGNLKTITDAENHTTTYTYDSLSRLTQITDSQGYTTRYFYDANDNLTKKTDANNQVTEYEYDSLNQLTKVFYGSKVSPIKTISFTYDKVGNMLTWSDGTYSASYTYDKLNRLTQVSTTYPFGARTVSYTYDKVGNKKTLTAEGLSPQGTVPITLTYTYDKLNRLTSIKDPAEKTTEYTYDAASRLTKKTLPNGVFTEYTYNNTNQLLSLTNKKSAAAVISSFSYTYDKVDNRLTMTTPEGTHTYAYDKIYRLSSADHPVQPDETYTYDKVGNRKTSSQHSSWTYDTNNRLTSFNGTSFTYDKNGNTLTKTKDASTTTYTYDYENRLIEGTVPEGGLSLSYTYDPFGKRLSKAVNSVTKYYFYDNEDIIAEYNSAGTVVASYIHGQGIDEPIQGLSPQGPVPEWFYTFDGLGTVSELTDNSQNIVESYKYDAFGNLETPPATGNPYTYTGREYDSESGLYYYRARYYDPSLGRFLSEDPILKKNINILYLLPLLLNESQQLNTYLYVKNNPINRIDPSGFLSCNGEWRRVHWDFMLPIILRMCVCYWLCEACEGVIWGGNPYTLPTTKGLVIYSGSGGDIKRGNECLCGPPGPQTGCDPCKNG